MHNHKNTAIKKLLERLFKLIETNPVKSDGLSNGKSGVALLYINYGTFVDNGEYGEKGLSYIEEVIQNIDNPNSVLGAMNLYSGLCGFLEVLSALKRSELLDIDMAQFEKLDQLLYEWAMAELEKNNHDFLLGPMGCINYFINRMPDETCKGHLENLLGQIVPKLEGNLLGIYALTNAHYNHIDKRETNEINYGIAHGMASLMLNFIKLANAEKGFDWLKDVIKKCVEQFISFNEDQNLSYPKCFIGSVNCETNKSTFQNRLGWCFSDLNIIHILLEYQILSDTDKYGSVIDTAIDGLVKRKDYSQTMIDDPYLCHGSIGIALYCRKLYLLSKDDRLKQAENFWIDHCVDFYDHVDDSYFYSAKFKEKNDISSFLYGPLGTCLCLMSLLDEDLSEWEKIILL